MPSLLYLPFNAIMSRKHLSRSPARARRNDGAICGTLRSCKYMVRFKAAHHFKAALFLLLSSEAPETLLGHALAQGRTAPISYLLVPTPTSFLGMQMGLPRTSPGRVVRTGRGGAGHGAEGTASLRPTPPSHGHTPSGGTHLMGKPSAMHELSLHVPDKDM